LTFGRILIASEDYTDNLGVLDQFWDKTVGDRKVRTKWYWQNGIQTKWCWTKWCGQNGQIMQVTGSQAKYVQELI